MHVEITLAIEHAYANNSVAGASALALLSELGGRMVRPESGSDGSTVVATFAFRNPVRRDQFLAEALAIPGVSIVMLH
jgi:hypothetical protein